MIRLVEEAGRDQRRQGASCTLKEKEKEGGRGMFNARTFFRRKASRPTTGTYVTAQTPRGEVKGVLVPFRGKQALQTRNGSIEPVMQATPVHEIGESTQVFIAAVRRRHWLT